MAKVDSHQESRPDPEENGEKWELASDKTFKKRCLVPGEGLDSPRDGSVCKIRIIPGKNTSIQMILGRSLRLGQNLDAILQVIIGEHDADFDYMLDELISDMKAGEKSIFQFQMCPVQRTTLQTAKESLPTENITLKLEVELVSFTEVPVIWDLNPAQLVDAARHHKEKGVEWYKGKNFLYALRRFVRAIKYLIVIDREMLEKLGKESSDAAALYAEYLQLLAVVHCNIAAVQMTAKNYQSVVDNCSKALVLDPANVKALYRRGVAYAKLDKPSDAKVDLFHALKLAPSDGNIRHELSLLGQNRT